MSSTPDVQLADFPRNHYNHTRPVPAVVDAVDDYTSREVVVTRSHDVEDAWRAGENMRADVGEREQVNLPRVDGGTEAWLFLSACFTIEALVWGFPFSFGVFQDYYNNLPLFSSNKSGIAIIGTCASGIMYLGAPFVFFALQVWPPFHRVATIAGLVIIIIALLASSFSNTVSHLILTQGILYAIGGSLLYSPAILYVDQWFVKRKGFAYGIMWAGTGCSGVVIPLIMSWGLERYGFRTMLRAWAVTLVVLSSPLIYYVKPRVPYNHAAASARRRTSFEFIKTPTFLFLQVGNIIEGLGFFIPGIYLPSYAHSLGLTTFSGSLIIALFNTTSVLGQVGFGILIDRMHVTSVIMISTIGATFSIFIFWGLSMSLPLLCVFALMYGVFGGGFTSTYSGVIKEIKSKTPSAETGSILGFLCAGRGIGAVCSGPLSEALLGEQTWKGVASLGYGTGYGQLIVFTGITALCGGLSFVGRRAKMM